MERLMMVTTFQKSIDLLKTTDCSQKEKLGLFAQITTCLQSPALRNNANYLNFVSQGLTILLLFCEELDSVTRMSAEENLNKIIRFSTPANIVRIQYDLFHEIKRNGNERSLRISLNLFGHYCHLIKQRKIKPYALNLLPCILAISHRKEQQLIETLSCFMQKFCKYLLIGLTENEVVNLIEIFINEAVTTDCSVKRRCSASNVISLIEHSKRPEIMAKHALTTCLDLLVKKFTSDNIIGALGLLRVLLPVVLAEAVLELCVVYKIIEIYEMCLHLLNNKNHTIINASLECLCIILSNSRPKLNEFLQSLQLKHMDILSKKRSLKNQIVRRKSSVESSQLNFISKNQLFTPEKVFRTIASKSADRPYENTDSKSDSNELSSPMKKSPNLLDSSQNLIDDKALLTCSDIELDSFRMNESETSESMGKSPAKSIVDGNTDAGTLTRQKSTDSIGSFFNTILTHPNTESVSKFFRVGSSTPQADATVMPHTPTSSKSLDYALEQSQSDLAENDNISVLSMSSFVSSNSQKSFGKFDANSKADESLPEIEILTDQEIATIKLESGEEQTRTDAVPSSAEVSVINLMFDSNPLANREIFIGSIADQSLISYTVRLVASKFLLNGIPRKTHDDTSVRISIKNSSLTVIGHCVALYPMILLLPLQKHEHFSEIGDIMRPQVHSSDSDDSISDGAISKKQQPDETKASEVGEQLNIKDDHFGENSNKATCTYFDFFSPLSKSADNVLLSQLTDSRSEKSKNSRKLCGNLSDLLSQSDIVDSKSAFEYSSRLDDANRLLLESSGNIYDSQTSDLTGTPQFIEDIFLFWNHSDPVLRTNIQLVAGNFLAKVFSEHEHITKFTDTCDTGTTYRFINSNVLFNILLHGLSDRVHTVVKQSLVSLERVLTVLLDHRQHWFSQKEESVSSSEETSSIVKIDFNNRRRSTMLELIFDNLLSVFENKYWVVQNKYCRFVTALNFDAINAIIGDEKGDEFKERFLSNVYCMLGNADQRIRNEAINALCDFCELQVQRVEYNAGLNANQQLITEFISEFLSQELPYPLYNLVNDPKVPVGDSNFVKVKRNIGKFFFNITNILMDLESNDRQFGAIKCLTKLLKSFSPIQYYEIWTEFNILEVLLALLQSNYQTGTDLSCQCDILTICANLFTASVLKANSAENEKTKTMISAFLVHVMKLLSIYHHILTNQRPIFVPKGQKADIFANSKELQMLNSLGYFGNDYFFLRIHKTISIFYENYKVNISEEIDTKLFALLNVCLDTLAVLLEIIDSSFQSIPFFDELLSYLKTFLQFASEKCVICIRQLIKYMFSMTYPSRKEHYKGFLNCTQSSTNEVFAGLESYRMYEETPVKSNRSDSITSESAGSKLMNLLGSTSTPEKRKANNSHKNIKLFEPIVIQCLKLFTKSDAMIQASILNMLGQVLQLKFNYSLLDANNIFMEFILKLLESIENGTIRNSYILTPKIIVFLFQLAKQESPQMSIPKIINITDTFLANSITKNGSIEALLELAKEIYFQKSLETKFSDENQLNAKELNTQKEVVFSMLLKFLNNSMVKKIICLILMKETENLGVIKAELSECLLHTFVDSGKPLICDLNDYQMVRQMVGATKPILTADDLSFAKVVKRFLNCSEKCPFEDIAVKTVLIDEIFSNISENELLHHIAGVTFTTDASTFLGDHIYNELLRFIMSASRDYDLFYEEDFDKIVNYLRIFDELFVALSKVMPLWPKTAQKIKENDQNRLVTAMLAFAQRLSTVTPTSLAISHRESFCARKTRFSMSLFEFVVQFYGFEILLNSINEISDQCIKWAALKFLIMKSPNASATSLLIEENLIELMHIDETFITKIGCRSEHFENIMQRLGDLIDREIILSKTIPLALDVIDAAEDVAARACIGHLLDSIFLKPNAYPQMDSSTRRRSFKILSSKIDELLKTSIGTTKEDSKIVLRDRFHHFKDKYQQFEIYSIVSSSVESILNTTKVAKLSAASAKVAAVNEEWFLSMATEAVRSNIDKSCLFQMLSEIKSESKLLRVLEQASISQKNLFPALIERAFESLTMKFKQDCFQHNGHANYLKMPLLLSQCIKIVCREMTLVSAEIHENNENDKPVYKSCRIPDSHVPNFREIMISLSKLLKSIDQLEKECLIYIEAQSIKKFLDEHFYRALCFDKLMQFAIVCLNFIEQCTPANDSRNLTDVAIACDCLATILNAHTIKMESVNETHACELSSFFETLLDVSYQLVSRYLVSGPFLEKNQLSKIIEEQTRAQKADDKVEALYAKAIILGKFIEIYYCDDQIEQKAVLTTDLHHLNALENSLISLVITVLRNDSFYFFAVTPHEIVKSFDWKFNIDPHTKKYALPSIPVDYLNEAEVIEKVVRRINIFGFCTRQNFEEFFMSFLLLINKDNDANVVDTQEAYKIKSICLTAIIELLLSCKVFPDVGKRISGKFHHVPRCKRLKADSIGVKKLHKVQNQFLPEPTVFYLPNLERCLHINNVDYKNENGVNDVIGTNEFRSNQYELNIMWHIIEEQPVISKSYSVELNNMKYFVKNSSIDVKSSIQLTFDVITQLSDEHQIQILPHIAKFSEICENREQFHWIKNTMMKLQESIHIENAICHQYIIYCLCKSFAVLVPTISELNHLCSLLGVYLKSSHLYVQIAALKGLLCLFESCIKTNTTIGGLSEEILLLRNFIAGYVTKHGIVEESPFAFSNEHTILVWALNLYVIETTSKFITECNLVANTIISANNILKRTNNLTQFLCIVHGLERIIITNSTTKFFQDKIERLALDLVKLENEKFSLASLKLLVTCIYIGSNDQLENTERCNGIVQDEPEVIVQSTEKIEILFNRIKLSTKTAAHIYGNVLCQLTHDLVPPKELLTKVIKELLTTSQPHCEVIAKVLFEIFRSAIDSSYFPLLQDWLLCSLPNFLAFPIQKTMWYLTVIFISASINLDLIKVFPQVIASHSDVVQSARDKSEENSSADQTVTVRYSLFTLACRDFYQRLSSEQKLTFRDIFSSLNKSEFIEMLNNL